MEFSVGVGKGYRPADKNKSEEMPIGTIPIDSIFSPVRRANYVVTPARVGRDTDFDKLDARNLDRRDRRTRSRHWPTRRRSSKSSSRSSSTSTSRSSPCFRPPTSPRR